MNTLDTQYQNLLGLILGTGIEKEDRTGTGTLSIFGEQIRHNMADGFPLLTTKKMAIKTMMTELKWFLKGDTNIKYLVDNGCNIWNGDAYKKYAEQLVPGFHGPWYTQEQFIDLIKTNESFAKDWGELGPIYGKQWTDWNGIDQILNLINSLKKNPDSRRLMVNAWNVSELHEMTLPPCHYGFQVYTRPITQEEKINNPDKYRAISLIWNQRSVDTFLGLPFNIASYGMLLSLIAEEVNMVPEELIGNLGDTHLYSNHLEQALQQLQNEPKPNLPTLKLSNVDILNGQLDYEILNYESYSSIKAPLSN